MRRSRPHPTPRSGTFPLLPAVAAGLIAVGLALVAVEATAAPAKPAAKPAAKAPAKKAPAKPAAKAKAPVRKGLPEADVAQQRAYERVYLGDYDCEFGQRLTVAPIEASPSWVKVTTGKHSFEMKPVFSSTGAIRLEDHLGRGLLVQIANKSMLLDTRVGQRLVDNCSNAEQRAFMANAAANAASGNAATSIFAPPPAAAPAPASAPALGVAPAEAASAASAPR